MKFYARINKFVLWSFFILKNYDGCQDPKSIIYFLVNASRQVKYAIKMRTKYLAVICSDR